MKSEEIYIELKEICKRLNIKIIYEASGFTPGYAIVNGKKVIVINKFYNKEQKIEALAGSMREIDLSGVFLKPYIRDLIHPQRLEF